MSKGTKDLAMLLHGTAHSAAKHHSSKSQMVFGTVVRVDPSIQIQPLTGTISIEQDDLGWTLAAVAIRDTLVVNDNVLMVQVHGHYYVIDGVE